MDGWGEESHSRRGMEGDEGRVYEKEKKKRDKTEEINSHIKRKYPLNESLNLVLLENVKLHKSHQE